MRRGTTLKLSPKAFQGLIWAAAALLCVVVTAIVLVVTNRRPADGTTSSAATPMMAAPLVAAPEGAGEGSGAPEAGEVGPIDAPDIGGGEGPSNPAGAILDDPKPPPIIPDGEWPEPKEQPAEPDAGRRPAVSTRPQAISENAFIEASAEMVLASQAYAPTEVGEKAFRKVCDDILAQRGISRGAFEKMSDRIAANPKKSAEMRDRVFERVDELQRPRSVQLRPSATGLVDPKRKPQQVR